MSTCRRISAQWSRATASSVLIALRAMASAGWTLVQLLCTAHMTSSMPTNRLNIDHDHGRLLANGKGTSATKAIRPTNVRRVMARRVPTMRSPMTATRNAGVLG